MLHLFRQGAERRILLCGRNADVEFERWLRALNVPSKADIVKKSRMITDVPFPVLQTLRGSWRHETGTKPPIYVIVQGQARLYCTLLGSDIVVLCWGLKKSQKADPLLLSLAQKRAKEMLDEHAS